MSATAYGHPGLGAYGPWGNAVLLTIRDLSAGEKAMLGLIARAWVKPDRIMADRDELARLSSLSRPATGSLVRRLERAGFLVDVGMDEAQRRFYRLTVPESVAA